LKRTENIKESLLPSAEDIAFYNQFGWYKSPVIFSDQELDDAVQGAQDFYDGKIDFPLKSKLGLSDDQANLDLAIRNNEFVTLQQQKLRAIGWHTDKAYWPTCSSNKLLTVWIPLQDCTIDMGPVVYLNGSHKWKLEQEMREYFSFTSQDLESFENYQKSKNSSLKKSFMTLKRGQVSIHSCNTIHCSYPNVSDKTRLALAVHLQDDSNHYQKAFKADGTKIVIGYDQICSKDQNGDPNYHDDQIFPLI
tara:strand:- start:935 stop:1681 length:747 start_codon:yes stop_codon:yes gene_type:complete